MPTYGLEPFESAAAVYVWVGPKTPGFFRVAVKGHARKFSFGFKLVRDPHWIGGLSIDVMGWTGPFADPPVAAPYSVKETFHGLFQPEIVIVGANKQEVVAVREIPYTTEDEVLKAHDAA